MTNLPKLVKAEGATNYSSNGGSSWAIINDKDLDLALDFMQMYRNVDFYNEILPATSAIATYTPAKEGSNYTAGSEFFNGEPIFAEIVEFGAQTPSNITGPYYYDAREALGHGDHQHHSPGRRRGYRAGHCGGYGELHHGLLILTEFS